jgi:hypothetical protein
MKSIYLAFGFIAILINSLIGLMFTSYPIFNWLLSDVVIIINVFLLHLLSQSKISDGFKIGLTFVFSTLGLIMFLLSIKSESRLENNIMLAIVVILLSIQMVLLIITNSLKTNRK